MFQLFDETRKKRYPLTGELKSLGRSMECDLCFPDDELISRVHAQLQWDGSGWTVTDRSSTNGSFVNGLQIKSQKLKPGDVVRIGNIQLRFLPVPQGSDSYSVWEHKTQKTRSGDLSDVTPPPTHVSAQRFVPGQTKMDKDKKE